MKGNIKNQIWSFNSKKDAKEFVKEVEVLVGHKVEYMISEKHLGKVLVAIKGDSLETIVNGN